MMQEYSLHLRLPELLKLAKARYSFCGFLKAHFTILPNKDFVARVRKDSYSRILSDLVNDHRFEQAITDGTSLMLGYIDATRDLDMAELSERLGVDRTRLFKGISPLCGPPAPYEELWINYTQGTETLLNIAQTYRLGGLVLKENARERVDYIGVELEYMEHLARKEVSALEDEDTDETGRMRDLYEVFVREHPGCWVPLYVAKALEYAETDYYRGYLHILNGFVQAQKEALKLS